MKVLAFAGSNSTLSINKSLVSYAASLLEGAQVEMLDLNDFEMPIFSVDREQALGHPEQAINFMSKIEHCDAVIISFAEHNGSYSAAYKNIFDWCSRINPKVYQGKPVVLLSTSPGAGGAGGVLAFAVNSMQFFDGHVKGSLSVPKFGENFDLDTGRLVNQDLDAKLRQIMSNLSDS
jgi:NAD(P)H-dependent FMN reductase